MKKLIVDCSTGISTELELTAEEIAEIEANAEIWKQKEAEAAAAAAEKEAAKTSAIRKLEAVGLTADEIAALTK
jgi:hypothetical protein